MSLEVASDYGAGAGPAGRLLPRVGAPRRIGLNLGTIQGTYNNSWRNSAAFIVLLRVDRASRPLFIPALVRTTALM